MRHRLAALACSALILGASVPTLAEEEKAKVDIMNPYVEEQKAVVQRSVDTGRQYTDRWYEYVGERYGTTLERPESGLYDSASSDESEKPEREALKAARALFKEYKSYLAEYNPDIIDLYDPFAQIVVTFRHQSGRSREQSFTMTQFSDKVQQDMLLMKAHEEQPAFTDVKYARKGEGVKISATVTYPHYHFTTPLVLIVKPDQDDAKSGRWEIVEQHYRQRM